MTFAEFYEKKKQHEIAELNRSYDDINKMLSEIRDKLHGEERVLSLRELTDLKSQIDEYISLLRSIKLTVRELAHFKETEHLVKRNEEYAIDAIRSLEASVEVVKDRIYKREVEQLAKLPRTFKTDLSAEQIISLRKELMDLNFIADISQKDFDYIFSDKPINPEMKPISWQLNRGKMALRELISAMTETTVHKEQVRQCFVDTAGSPIDIPKPKSGEYSQYYTTIEGMVKRIKQ